MNTNNLIILGLVCILCYIIYNKNLEKFWVYGAGTRICNNRGCDTRYVQDKGTYYCKNKDIETSK